MNRVTLLPRRLLRCGLLVEILCAGAIPLNAQQGGSRAFDLEQAGQYAKAVDAYRAVLAQHPADATALLGLERSLASLGRGSEVMPAVSAALAADSSSPLIYSVAARGYAAARQPDSLRWAAERWARLEPGEDTPYREWARLAVQVGDRKMARAALEQGQSAIDRPDALAAEMAQLDQADGNYTAAATGWVRAVEFLPGYETTARTALLGVPSAARGAVLQGLRAGKAPAAKLLEAELRAAWGDPVGGFNALAPALGSPAAAIQMLRQFLTAVQIDQTPAGARARAMALQALAERLPPGDEAARTRLEAARAYTEAGDAAGAQRVLGQVDTAKVAATDPGAAVELLLGQGKIAEAAQRLAAVEGRIRADRFGALRRRVAWAWAVGGHPDEADSLLRPDSTVDGLAVAGRIHLLQGDVSGARQRLQAAGPYAGGRVQATARAALLALLQPIQSDTLPQLGAAFTVLERGDTARAAAAFAHAAEQLPPDGGAPDLLLFAGRLALSQGNTADAEHAFRAADVAAAPAVAPAAELELARLLVATGRQKDAVATLEHLILTYPESALVPEARRLRDQARGATPRT